MARRSPPQDSSFDSDDSDLERTLGRTMAAGAGSTTGDLDDSAIVDACAELVDDFLEERLDALFTSAREHFFTRARDAESAEDEARQMALLEEVEAMEPPICGAFESSLRVRLASLSLGEVVLPTLESPEAKSDSQNQLLELVATRKLDNWVRFTSIIRRHQGALGPAQESLERHLTRLSGAVITSDNNPLGVTGMCALFHDAMAGTVSSRDTRTAIFEAFESEIIGHLEQLMSDIVARLEQPEAAADDADTDDEPADSGLLAAASARDAETLVDEGAITATDEDVPVAPVDIDRLQGLVTRIQRDARALGLSDTDDANAMQRWLSDGTSHSNETRAVVSTLGQLAADVLADSKLSDDVRRRVARLAIPMLRLAARDDEHADTDADAARHDPVTGLQDRAAFLGRLERILSQSKAGSTSICLICVDGYEDIRREAGAQVAGRVMRLLATQLVKHGGTSGTTARIADDTLAVMLEGFGQSWGKRFCSRFLRTLRQSTFQHAGKKMDVRISIGIAAARGAKPGPTTLMKRATAARREATAAGGNRICVARRQKPTL